MSEGSSNETYNLISYELHSLLPFPHSVNACLGLPVQGSGVVACTENIFSSAAHTPQASIFENKFRISQQAVCSFPFLCSTDLQI